MKKISMSDDVKQYWAYKEIKKNKYKVELLKDKENNIIIKIKDYINDLITTFKIVEFENMLFIYNDNELINDEVDFTNTVDECVKSSIYYFSTRY